MKSRKKQMANIVTCIRIVLSFTLLFLPALSPAFLFVYIAAGVSDMIDGAIARKIGVASEFGSKLDTIADIILVAVCLIKLLPLMSAPDWLYIWIGIIAAIKGANIVAGYIRNKALMSVHSLINKATGIMLFLFPLTLPLIDIKYSAVAVCVVATVAAVYEGYLINQKGSIAFK